MKKIKFGIIGMGNQGSYYAGLFRVGKIENGELVAVCDNNAVKLSMAKKKNEGVLAFSDYTEMLDSGVCEAVLVDTPHYLHPEIVIECLKRGIHAISDKPAGVYTKQVREMNEFALKSKAKFGVMFNLRTDCMYRKMKEMIEKGEIGELQRVVWVITNWFRSQTYYDSGSWRATWAGEGGGVLINQCPHQIDLIQWILGKTPKSVRAVCHYGKWHDIEVEDDVSAYFEYDNGATGVFVTTTGEAPGANRLEISGTKGKILCENGQIVFYKNERDSVEFSKTSKSLFDAPACEKIIVETDGKNPQHAGIIDNVAKAILGTEEQFVLGTEGIKGVELMNAIELSGWKNGAEVTLPINEEEYLAELNKRRAVSKIKTGGTDVIADMDNSFSKTTETLKKV